MEIFWSAGRRDQGLIGLKGADLGSGETTGSPGQLINGIIPRSTHCIFKGTGAGLKLVLRLFDESAQWSPGRAAGLQPVNFPASLIEIHFGLMADCFCYLGWICPQV